VKITRLLYSRGMSKSELKHYFIFLDWLDGKRNEQVQYSDFNIYYQAFNNFWTHFDPDTMDMVGEG